MNSFETEIETKTAVKKGKRLNSEIHNTTLTIDFNERLGTITAVKKRKHYPRYEQYLRINSIIREFMNNATDIS